MAGPLNGIRVLDLSSVLMGPSATQALAEMGASVIKVESLTGDTTRKIGPSARTDSMGSNFLNMNRGKRSIALDLKHPLGVKTLRQLLAQADVLIHNIRPQAAARLGLSYEAVAAIKPDIVYCALNGFGSTGPYAGQSAYDDIIQGLAGLPALGAQSGQAPRYVPTPIADRVAGLQAVIAVTGALLHRERTGEGQLVEVPMFESMAHVVLSDHLYGRTFVPARGEAGYTRVLSPSRHPYQTADGYVCVLIYTDRHWAAFFDLVGRPDLAEDPRYATMRARNMNIDMLYGFVAETLARKTTEAWLTAFRSVDIPAGPMNTLDTLIDDPHLNAVGFFEEIDHPSEGRLRALRAPVSWSRSHPESLCAAPNLGEHGLAILREAGLSEPEIAALYDAGVLGGPALEPAGRLERVTGLR